MSTQLASRVHRANASTRYEVEVASPPRKFSFIYIHILQHLERAYEPIMLLN